MLFDELAGTMGDSPTNTFIVPTTFLVLNEYLFDPHDHFFRLHLPKIYNSDQSIS
jgi:hypothetical protein